MKKIILSILLVLVLGFIVAQFFPPKKNLGEVTQTHFVNQEGIPADIKTMLKTSCFDCHSNHTTYLWYDKIAPASWLVSSHINEGKHHLNFSEWGKADTLDQIKMLDEISEVLTDKSMPLTSYTFLHTDAKLKQVERDKIIAWTEKYSEELLNGLRN
jgi:hypothetical protein